MVQSTGLVKEYKILCKSTQTRLLEDIYNFSKLEFLYMYKQYIYSILYISPY